MHEQANCQPRRGVATSFSGTCLDASALLAYRRAETAWVLAIHGCKDLAWALTCTCLQGLYYTNQQVLR